MEMRGAASGGPNPFYMGSLGLVHTVTISGVDHCFEDVFSVRPTQSFWGHIGFGHRARRGDSGAWITDVSQSNWYGMVIAVDGTECFAVESAKVMSWISSDLGGQQISVY